jgi:uncharacterized protein YfaQ (DUF2300 family)
MSKIQQELTSLLRAKYGECADVSDVITFLRSSGALDDVLMRRAVVHERFFEALATTTDSARSIALDLSVQYEVSLSTAKRYQLV